MSARIGSLAAIEARVWEELQRASREPGHDWRTLVLATGGDDRADARTVVLRDVDAAARTLLFYTDARSPKVAQITRVPLGTLLAWSRALGWQLRLAVRLQVQTAGLDVSSRWARLKLTPAAQDYLAPLPPGRRLEHGAEPERASRGHFALVRAEVQAIDWLELHADGHRRAGFGHDGANWLQP
jgi:hypothetical protein